VTVTFAVENDFSQGTFNVSLDEVSLGSWETPLPVSIDPPHVEEWSSSTITITGSNFIATPTIRICDQVVTNVEWLNSQTLNVTLPAALPVGYCRVWVVNPHGQAGQCPQQLRIGRSVFLPLVYQP
jgi:hypothetical protein